MKLKDMINNNNNMRLGDMVNNNCATTREVMTIKYYVEYIDNGVECSDIWSQECLDRELQLKEVEITHIELAYSLQEKLGLA